MDIFNKAIAIIGEATEHDKREEWSDALQKYKLGIDYFMHFMKYNKNPSTNTTVKAKISTYLTRAEEIKKIMENGVARKAAPVAGGGGGNGGNKGQNGQDGKDEEDEKLSGAIANAIVREKPNVHWDDVAGLEKAKAALQEAVILPAKFPQLFVGKRRPWQGILLYGPPGTGKSYIAKAVATECQATFFSVSSSDLVSKWQGESEKLVRALFEMARKEKPSIVFIDEIDSLASARSDNESESSRRIKTEILVQMQGVGSDQSGVLVLAATNIPQNLDSAIRRRFEKRICINLPELEPRLNMFKIHIKGTPNTLTEDDFKTLAGMTDGFSASDIANVVRDALMNPIRKMQTATAFKQRPDGKYMACDPSEPGAIRKTLMEFNGDEIGTPDVTMDDFLNALKNVKKSVGPDDLKAIDEFTKLYGVE